MTAVEESETIRVLFVCSRNRWRSPTAEAIYSRRPSILARSRGTGRVARQPVKTEDLQWADLVFAMEAKHKQRLLAEFPRDTRTKDIHVLDIPDFYRFMDPELVDEILAAVDPILPRRLG